MKKVLITGVCGMIGSHLLDELLKGDCEVVGLDNLKVGKKDNILHNIKDQKFKFIKGDILNFDVVNNATKEIDIIIHLAASKKSDENGKAFDTLRINTQGTQNILEAAKKRSIKVVLASTSDVYGVSNALPFKESGNLVVGPPTAKRWAYAVSKIYAEQLSFTYYKELKVPIVIVRYFGGFSPRASFTWSGGHIPLFIDAILNDKEVVIHGDGKQTRSMAYVDDIIRGTILAMGNPKAVGEIFNIGNYEELSVIDTAKLIHQIANTGKKLKIKYIPCEKIFGTYKDIKRRVPDLKKAKDILGYTPKIKLSDGISRMIKEYLDKQSKNKK